MTVYEFVFVEYERDGNDNVIGGKVVYTGMVVAKTVEDARVAIGVELCTELGHDAATISRGQVLVRPFK